MKRERIEWYSGALVVLLILAGSILCSGCTDPSGWLGGNRGETKITVNVTQTASEPKARSPFVDGGDIEDATAATTQPVGGVANYSVVNAGGNSTSMTDGGLMGGDNTANPPAAPVKAEPQPVPPATQPAKPLPPS